MDPDQFIISDTSCLIALERIDKLEILKDLFSKVFITNEVAIEFGNTLPQWIVVRTVKNLNKQNELSKLVDIGEASSIALALEIPQATLVIDERKGRKIAKELNLKIIGTLKVLLKAKENGVISSVQEIIDQLEENEFRFSQAIVTSLLKQANELKP